MVKILRRFRLLIVVDIPLFVRRLFNRNKEPVIISRDCIGGFVYNQYKMQFYSPTINLLFDMDDFNIFCRNLQEYLNGVFEKGDSDSYPVGLLHARYENLPILKVNFVHYSSYEKAIEKWNIRRSRCLKRMDNIYVINNCTNDEEACKINKDTIADFNKIPYKKVIFVREKLGFDDEFVVKPIKEYKNSFILDRYPGSWKRVFNNFSFNKFLRRKDHD